MSEPTKKMPVSFKVVPIAGGYAVQEHYLFGGAKALENFLKDAPLGDEFRLSVSTFYRLDPISHPPDMLDTEAWEAKVKELTGVGS